VVNGLIGGMRNLGHELSSAFLVLADSRSKFVWARDLILFHAMVAGIQRGSDSYRTLKFKTGAVIKYALNQGDIQSVREVMVDQIYRLPNSITPSVMVDLGANIGLASVFYHCEYDCEVIICVEPLLRNVTMLEENIKLNGMTALVHHAAISSTAGTVRFKSDRCSNLGRIDNDDGDILVSSITMNEVLRNTPNNWIDLLKIDIEGHEQTFLSQNNGWLERVGAILIEFHPTLVDYPASIKLLKCNGFRYYPPAYTRKAEAWEGPTDLFVREPGLLSYPSALNDAAL
jgi:FkbM family methyltransferase